MFDGYSGASSIKDNEHQRRQRRHHQSLCTLTQTLCFHLAEWMAFSRDANKQQLIKLIINELKDRGCKVIPAHADADVDIVKAATESAKFRDNSLVGEDTDFLILLLHYAEVGGKNLYFR